MDIPVSSVYHQNMTSPTEASNWDDLMATPQTFQFRKMIDLVERMWVEKKRYPTTNEFRDVLGGNSIELSRVRSLLDHPTFENMVAERGLSPDIDAGLKPEQIAAIQVFLNVADRRPWGHKLAEIGVKTIQWNGWMRNAKFKEIVEQEAQKLFADGMPMAHQALMSGVAKGDMRAVKLFYDKIGFGADVQNSSIRDIQTIVVTLIEIIQKHVTDQATLKRIADDFDLATAALTPKQLDLNQTHMPTPAKVRGEIL